MKKNNRALLLDSLFILLGSALTAMGIAVFTAPNQIAPGGISGIATVFSYVTDLPVGLLSLLCNVPLMLIAWRKLGLSALSKTMAATVLLSIGIDLFTGILPPYQNNTLLAALTGGALAGAGMGLLLVRGISTGGTDLIGLMLHQRRPTLSMGQLLMIIDTAVVIFAVIVFQDIEVALYSGITILVTSKCIDVIQQGVDHAKIIYIVTDQAEAFLERMAHQMGRGVTVLPARGGFTGKEKAMLMTIARRSEISSTLQMINELDPDAFTILFDATEVRGEGFKGMKD